MTYLERALEIHKEEGDKNIGSDWITENRCPYDYELDEFKECREDNIDKERCKDCWNREMPNTDKSILLLIGENYESSVVKKIKEQEEKMVKDIVNECLNNTEPQVAITKDDLELEYNKGLNDAWELARKIFTFNKNKMEDVFGFVEKRYVFDNLSPQEAFVKTKAYEEAQIEVGDVVKVEKGVEFIVTLISDDSHLFGITATGDTYTAIPIKHCKKTGKHIDIQSILKQIRNK